MSRRAVSAPPFPCLQSPEVRRAYDLCEAALDDNNDEYRQLAESALPDFAETQHDEDKPFWWQLYEIDLYNHRPVMAWFKPLLTPGDPGAAFENSAKGLYALAGVTELEAQALLLYHRGESFRRIARSLGISPSSVQDRISRGEARLAALIGG